MSTTTWCNMIQKLQRIFEIQHFYFFQDWWFIKEICQTLYIRFWFGFSHVFSKIFELFFRWSTKIFFQNIFFWDIRPGWSPQKWIFITIRSRTLSPDHRISLSKNCQKSGKYLCFGTYSNGRNHIQVSSMMVGLNDSGWNYVTNSVSGELQHREVGDLLKIDGFRCFETPFQK